MREAAIATALHASDARKPADGFDSGEAAAALGRMPIWRIELATA